MRKRRGISAGTLIMLFMTVAVLLGCSWVLPKLSGGSAIPLDAQQMVSAIVADLSLPQLTLSDIPITHSRSPQQPTPTPAGPLTMAFESQAATMVPVLAQSLPATPAPTSSPTPEPPRYSFSLTAGGSVTLTSAIRKSVYHAESKTYDFTPLFAHLSSRMDSDLCLVTLENTLDDSKNFSDLNVTSEAAASLRSLGADVIAAGYPKALDNGMDSLASTLSTLKQSGFSTIGAFAAPEDAQQPLIFNLKGAKVAVLHYTDALSSKGKAVAKESGSFAIPLLNIDTASQAIAQLRQQGAEVVVVSVNWGSVGKASPTEAQRKLAQQLANAGADIILGAHSQMLQPVEMLTAARADGTTAQALVAYSLGALLTPEREDTRYIAGMLLHLNLTYDTGTRSLHFDEVAYTPTYIWRYKEDNLYQYRVVISNQEAPAGMSESQQEVMSRALKAAQKALDGSAVTPR